MAVKKKKAPAKKKAAPKRAAAKKAAPKKAATRKAAPKKAAAKKAAPKKAAANKRPTAIKQKLTKSQILEQIAESTGLSRKEVAAVLNEMSSLMGRSIMKNGAGEFVVPGSFKVVTINKPAKKARKGINPFTGEPTTFKARPASVAVKIRPLKGLKEFANS